jgi:hypothetical protein
MDYAGVAAVIVLESVNSRKGRDRGIPLLANEARGGAPGIYTRSFPAKCGVGIQPVILSGFGGREASDNAVESLP